MKFIFGILLQILVVLLGCIAVVALPAGIFLSKAVLKAYKRAKRYDRAIKIGLLSPDLLGKLVKMEGELVLHESKELLAPLSLKPVVKWRLDFFAGGDSNPDGTDHNILISPEPLALKNEQGEKVIVKDIHFIMTRMPRFKGEATTEGKRNLVNYLKKEGYEITENQASKVQERSIPVGTRAFAVGILEMREGKYTLLSPSEDPYAPISALYEKDLSYGEVWRLAAISLGLTIGGGLVGWVAIEIWKITSSWGIPSF
ncbi:MAG: hypothetical protein NZ551_06640 [Microscillaceae bacterium]|nr:hypothetical protein [Microscillaceae bacterium]MDW8460871.1 hypothetical protein [Cytophagales bacterium]